MASPSPIFEPQSTADELADHPCRLLLVESPGGPAFPPLCQYCGQPASGRLGVSKVFRVRDSSGAPDDYVIRSLEVPYCGECIARHHQASRPIGWMRIAAVSMADGLSVSAAGCALMATMLLPGGLASLFQPGFPLPAVIVLGFGAIAWSSAKGAWRQTAHRRVPAQTPISRAFDFTDADGALFAPRRTTYSIRNPAFAEAFRVLNSAYSWGPKGPVAAGAAKARACP